MSHTSSDSLWTDEELLQAPDSAEEYLRKKIMRLMVVEPDSSESVLSVDSEGHPPLEEKP